MPKLEWKLRSIIRSQNLTHYINQCYIKKVKLKQNHGIIFVEKSEDSFPKHAEITSATPLPYS